MRDSSVSMAHYIIDCEQLQHLKYKMEIPDALVSFQTARYCMLGWATFQLC